MISFILGLILLINYPNLNIYYPQFSDIQLVTETIPSKTDTSVVFVASASFTGDYLDTFTHSNIAGYHVSNGITYKGYKCPVNNGMFLWSDTLGAKFIKCSHEDSLKIINKYNPQMAFSQHLIIYNGVVQSYCFSSNAVNTYRVLAEKNGKLCIIDCKKPMSFDKFVKELKDYNVTNAIYLDMGGWAYSWYRKLNNEVVELYSPYNEYATNWITFIKK